MVCKIVRNTLLTEHLYNCNFLKMGHCQQCLEHPRWIPLSRNTNLKCTVHLYRFFLGSINFQCMFSLVYTVYCQKQPPESRCSVKKVVLKNFVNFMGKHLCWSLLNKVADLTPILKNICQRLLLHCTHTTHCYLSVLLYLQQLLLIINVTAQKHSSGGVR